MYFNALIDMEIFNKEHVYDRVNWDTILYNNVCISIIWVFVSITSSE